MGMAEKQETTETPSGEEQAAQYAVAGLLAAHDLVKAEDFVDVEFSELAAHATKLQAERAATREVVLREVLGVPEDEDPMQALAQLREAQTAAPDEVSGAGGEGQTQSSTGDPTASGATYTANMAATLSQTAASNVGAGVGGGVQVGVTNDPRAIGGMLPPENLFGRNKIEWSFENIAKLQEHDPILRQVYEAGIVPPDRYKPPNAF